jgi:hypothetical protein
LFQWEISFKIFLRNSWPTKMQIWLKGDLMQSQVVKSHGPGAVGATIKKSNFMRNISQNDSSERCGPWASCFCMAPLSICLSVPSLVFFDFSRNTGTIFTRLGTNHLWKTRIQNCLNEWQCTYPKGDNSKTIKISCIQNQQAIFIQTWYKSSLNKGNSKFFK